jgi:predicted Zn-dependent protease with MMP-like domain
VKLKQFERRAREAFAEIPDEFKEGIDGLTVSREAPAHPTLPGVFTLGHCVTEEHLSEYGSPETTRSVIVLYWGSFRELATRDPEFDWEEELWETLTHEVRHHLESLAGDDALEDVDHAADELFNRQEGLPFDPWYYQSGEDLGGGVFVVEGRQHLEQLWDPVDFERAEEIRFSWRGQTYRAPRPGRLGDVHFVWVTGPDLVDDPLELVLVRRRSSWESLAGLVRRRKPVVLESEVDVVPEVE